MSATPNHEAGRVEGESRKAAALAYLAQKRAVYIRQAQRALLLALLERGNATADDIRAKVKLPAGLNPKLFGAAPGPLARKGIIEPAGFRNTHRPEAHARTLRVWRLADRAKAEEWLANHPEPPRRASGVPTASRQGLLFDVAESATAAGF